MGLVDTAFEYVQVSLAWVGTVMAVALWGLGALPYWVHMTYPPLDAVLLFTAGAYTRPLFGSTKAHFVEYVGCVIFPWSIRQ